MRAAPCIIAPSVNTVLNKSTLRKAVAAAALLCIASHIGLAQRAVLIESYPATTPGTATLYLAASANQWNPADEAWAFSLEDGLYLLDISEDSPLTFQGKVTRGTWSSVEGNASGTFLPNRNFDFSESDTLLIEVLSWEDLQNPPSDLPPNVVLLDEAFFMPQLMRSRRVRLFLPSDYDDEGNDAHYPVLYMQDGQNLFSAQEAFAGEWEVDESLLELEEQSYPGAIVVAIDNGGVHRIDEYSPYAHPVHGGGDGAAYAAFLAETLKPYVDEHYRTLPEREHNGIMGSSLGALISFYTALAYQEHFSKVGVFSPSFWFNDSIYDFAYSAGMQHDMRLFFLAGSLESSSLDQQVSDMIDTLTLAGFEPDEMRYDFVEGGQHSEWFWAAHFSEAFQWLYIGETLSTHKVEDAAGRLVPYPNPTESSFRLVGKNGMRADSALLENIRALQLMDYSGRVLRQYSGGAGPFDLSTLAGGMYLLRLETASGVYTEKLIKL